MASWLRSGGCLLLLFCVSHALARHIGHHSKVTRVCTVRAHIRLANIADVSALRASEIKRRLQDLGISTANVFEKDELVRLLVAAEAESPASSNRLPISAHGTKQGYGGVMTAADEKLYRGFDVQLPDLGMQIPFVVDTASSSSLISPALASRLNRDSTGATVTASTATGGLAGLTQVSLGRAGIGGVPCGPLQPVVMELPLADDERVGLLGLDVLSRLDVDLRFADGVAFAYPLGGFAASAAAGQGSRLRAVRCRQGAAGLLACEVRLSTPSCEGVVITAIVDSGSPTTLANWAAAEAAGISRASARLSDTAAVVGVSGEPIRIAEAGATVRLGDDGSGAARSVVLSIGDLPIFAALGKGTSPAIIVGLDVIGNDRLALSVGTGTMWVAESTS